MKITGMPAARALAETRLIRPMTSADSKALCSPSHNPCWTSMTRSAVFIAGVRRLARETTLQHRSPPVVREVASRGVSPNLARGVWVERAVGQHIGAEPSLGPPSEYPGPLLSAQLCGSSVSLRQRIPHARERLVDGCKELPHR